LEVAEQANTARRKNGDRDGWETFDGGAEAEASVTEKAEWNAFDDMDWGDL